MASVGDTLGRSGWSGMAATSAPAIPQASVPVTDQTPHITGSNIGAATSSNASQAPGDRMILHIAAGYVLAAILLLWLLGGIVFKSARG